MAYTVTLTPSAEKDFRRLDRKAQEQVAVAIDSLASNAHPVGCRKLAGQKNEPPIYRIRVGRYRVLYEVRQRKLTIVIVRLGHRGEVYR